MIGMRGREAVAHPDKEAWHQRALLEEEIPIVPTLGTCAQGDGRTARGASDPTRHTELHDYRNLTPERAVESTRTTHAASRVPMAARISCAN